MKVLIISTLNEKSGSCVVIDNMMDALRARSVCTSLWAPSGEFLNPDEIIPGGLISSLFYMLRNKNRLQDFDKIVVYTIRGVFIHLLINRSILYVHEINSKASLKYKLVNMIINLNKSQLFVVNPEIEKKYPCCDVKSIGNIYLNNIDNTSEFKNGSVLMIGAFTFDKGIDLLKELAIKYPNIEFYFLTTLLKQDRVRQLEFEQYCLNAPENLFVTTDQTKKRTLLDKSSYLISLSRLDESFGLVIFEAVQHNCLPLVFSNTGSRYLLGDYPFLPNDEYLDGFDLLLDKVKAKVDLSKIRRDFIHRFGENQIVEKFVSDE